jgi:uracil-DNA glycosylase family 4
MKYIPGKGNPRAKLMIIADAPGAHEEEDGEPISGPTGNLISQFLKEAGSSFSETYRTNVVKFRPPNDKVKDLKLIGKDIDDFLPQLWEEIKTIKPNCILAIGQLAFEITTGLKGIKIKEARGSILRTWNGSTKVVPTFSPSALVGYRAEKGETFKYSAKVYIQLDFNRAVEESRTDAYSIPDRTITIARNSLDVFRYLRNNEARDTVAVDIETIKCIPSCIGFSFTPSEGISIPLTHIGVEAGGMTVTELAESWKLVDKVLRDARIKKIGQNFKFDQQKLELIGFRVNNFWADTMLIAHTLYPELPKSLEFLTSIYTREPFYKNEGRDFDPRKHKPEQFLRYNAKDAIVTREIYDAQLVELEEAGLTSFYFDYVHKFHELYRRLEFEGLLLDKARLKELREDYREQRLRIQDELDTLVGHNLNVNSPKQVAITLFKELRIPVRKKTDEDTLVALLNNTVKDEKRKEILRKVLKLRRVRKMISSYLSAKADFDGRMRTSYRITGTETSRSSTSVLEAPLRNEQVGLAFQTMTKHGDTGTELRSIFLPDPGFIFVEVDLSQAEARIVALLSEDSELLSLFELGVDVHKRTAANIFFDDVTKTSKIDKGMRFIGKESRHAGNYDVQKKRFMQMVNSDAKKFGIDVEISEWKANQILEKFHAMHPKIRAVFHAGVVRVLEENNRTLVNAYGRPRQFLERWDDALFRSAFAQIPQSTVADKTKSSMLAILARLPDTRFVLEAHDAFLALVPRGEEKDRIAIYLEEFGRAINFDRCSLGSGSLVIPGEAMIGDNYKELVPFKG